MGPSGRKEWLVFSGERDDFPVWAEKFEGYIHTCGKEGAVLRKVLLGETTTGESIDDQKYTIWAELVQMLDKTSIMLVRRDCKGDGPRAWAMLADHFASQEKPRIMMLMEDLTSLKMKERETMSGYLF